MQKNNQQGWLKTFPKEVMGLRHDYPVNLWSDYPVRPLSVELPPFFSSTGIIKLNVDKREIAPWREDKKLLVTEIYFLKRAYVLIDLIILNIQEKSLSSKFPPSGA